VGENLPPLIVKIMMLLRANALARGNSGIKLSTLEHLLSMINNNIIPVIPSQGSVGSSGDLAPLSHLVLAMIGEGDVQIVKNVWMRNHHHKK
jgi:histidine ammonia-lyase